MLFLAATLVGWMILFTERWQPRTYFFNMFLMLSIQAVRRLPRLRAPGIVPCIISFLHATPLFPHGVTIVC